MSEDESKSKRANPRAPLKIDLSSHLFTSEERKPIRCLGVDVSRNGLGIVGFDPLPQGAVVILSVNGKGISLEVVWSKVDTVRTGVFHVGLRSNDIKTDLEKELKTAGLLKQVEQWKFPTHKRS